MDTVADQRLAPIPVLPATDPQPFELISIVHNIMRLDWQSTNTTKHRHSEEQDHNMGVRKRPRVQAKVGSKYTTYTSTAWQKLDRKWWISKDSAPARLFQISSPYRLIKHERYGASKAYATVGLIHADVYRKGQVVKPVHRE